MKAVGGGQSAGDVGVGPAEYRAALRHYPAGVTIVTLASATGPVGFTATSLASVSLTPPLVSFNIAHRSSSLAAIHTADSIVIHLLGDHQVELARRFAAHAAERFSDSSIWRTLETGEPVLNSTPLWIRATIERRIDVGDHSVVIAAVKQVQHDPEQRLRGPLLYYDGRYHRAVEVEE